MEQRLKDRYPDLEMINASISGETTGGALRRLPRLMEEHQPDLVLVELGGNDGLRGFQIGLIRRNLDAILGQITAQGSEAMLMEIQLPPNYGPRYTRLFTGLFAELAQQRQVDLIPFFLADLATEPGMMQGDGIHPTARAQPLMVDVVEPYLQQQLQRLVNEG